MCKNYRNFGSVIPIDNLHGIKVVNLIPKLIMRTYLDFIHFKRPCAV